MRETERDGMRGESESSAAVRVFRVAELLLLLEPGEGVGSTPAARWRTLDEDAECSTVVADDGAGVVGAFSCCRQRAPIGRERRAFPALKWRSNCHGQQPHSLAVCIGILPIYLRYLSRVQLDDHTAPITIYFTVRCGEYRIYNEIALETLLRGKDTG